VKLPLIANCNDTKLGAYELYEYHTYPSAAGMLAQRSMFQHFSPSQRVFVSEFASRGADSGDGNLRAAIAEAAYMNGMEQSPVVHMAASAARPTSQPSTSLPLLP
jgi:hypothetical protein